MATCATFWLGICFAALGVARPRTASNRSERVVSVGRAFVVRRRLCVVQEHHNEGNVCQCEGRDGSDRRLEHSGFANDARLPEHAWPTAACDL